MVQHKHRWARQSPYRHAPAVGVISAVGVLHGCLTAGDGHPATNGSVSLFGTGESPSYTSTGGSTNGKGTGGTKSSVGGSKSGTGGSIGITATGGSGTVTGGASNKATGGSTSTYSCSNLPVIFGTSATSACNQCVAAQCCNSDLACSANADCLAEVNCTGSCSSTGACTTSCEEAHLAGDQYLAPLFTCVANQCTRACFGGTNPCQGFEGNACGSELTGGDPARLHLCNNGTVLETSVCPSGCQVAPSGTQDYCIGSDFCVSNVFPQGTPVAICGANLSPNAVQSVLYQCNGSTTASSTVCANGCYAAPAGQADHCN